MTLRRIRPRAAHVLPIVLDPDAELTVLPGEPSSITVYEQEREEQIVLVDCHGNAYVNERPPLGFDPSRIMGLTGRGAA